MNKIPISAELINDIIKIKYPIDSKSPFWRCPDTPLKVFWDKMMEFYPEQNTAILIGLDGVHDHWTVVESITNDRINLYDSDRLKYFNKTRCTTQKPKYNRPHKIIPTHTFFLTKGSI